MEVKTLSNDFDRQTFNTLAPHPLQSWQWGDARKHMGIEVVRIGEFEKNKLKEVFQLTIHQLPFTNYQIGYLPRSIFPSEKVLEYLYEYARRNKIIFVKIEPYVSKSQKNFKYQITKSKHPLFPEWTQILDLTKSEEELLKNMHHKTRYNIKLAQKKGVIVKEMSDKEGFEIFSKLYFETCKRQQYYGHTPTYHQIVWESLKDSIAHILIAFYNNTPIAAYELFHFRDILYYPYGGTSLEYRNVMAPNLLMWEAIRFGKNLRATRFDMWGSLEPGYDQNHQWSGFTRFKEGYNGSFTQMAGSYDLVIHPTLYSIYSTLYSLRNIYLRI